MVQMNSQALCYVGHGLCKFQKNSEKKLFCIGRLKLNEKFVRQRGKMQKLTVETIVKVNSESTVRNLVDS